MTPFAPPPESKRCAAVIWWDWAVSGRCRERPVEGSDLCPTHRERELAGQPVKRVRAPQKVDRG